MCIADYRSAVTDSWVEYAVDQIDDQTREREDQRHHQHHAHHRVQLLAQQRIHPEMPEARPTEHRLDDDGPPEHAADRETKIGHNRNERILQREPVVDRALRQTDRLRQSDVVLRQGLQHPGPGQPGKHGDGANGESEGGQYQVPDRAPKQIESATQQTIDGVEAGDVRRWRLDKAQTPRTGKDAKIKKENDQENKAEPERGHGDAAWRAIDLLRSES